MVLRFCTSGTVIVRCKVVAIPALSSPSLKIVLPPQTYLVRLVQYWHCACVTRDLMQDRIRHWDLGLTLYNLVSLNSALNIARYRTRWSHAAGTLSVCKSALNCNFVA